MKLQQKGFSLLEVLIAVVVLAIGLLSLATLQITGLRYIGDSNFHYSAMLQSIDMAERMRANPVGLSDGAYASISGAGTDPGCITTFCSPSAMAATDAYQWNTLNAQLLPNGAGTVTLNGNTYTIAITWTEPAGFGTANQDQTYSLSITP
ncbi:MAG: type IV pilus modification protein PilV [Gammaproteobacteria bacterium]|nr:type IV pilus modification protein PilV [Gammaproteobacteria bacterium]